MQDNQLARSFIGSNTVAKTVCDTCDPTRTKNVSHPKLPIVDKFKPIKLIFESLALWLRIICLAILARVTPNYFYVFIQYNVVFNLMTGHLTSTLPYLGVQALRGLYMGSPLYQLLPVPYYGYQSGTPYLPYRLVKSL